MKDLKLLLETEDGTERMVKECIETVANSSGVIIFGAGVGGLSIYNILRKYRYLDKIVAFADNNPLKQGNSYCENRLVIENPSILFEKYGDSVTIIIASSAYDVIREQLIKYGFKKDRVLLYNFAFMNIEYSDKDFIYDHISDFERAYKRMSDDKSRAIFTLILNYRITKDPIFLEKMHPYVDDEYFQYFDNELIEYNENEIFLDVGAYTGDTLRVFNEIYPKWAFYIGLEADKKIYARLHATINELQIQDNVKLINAAAWDEKTKLLFTDNPGASTVSDGDMGETVDAIIVDDILDSSDVSFIKMDIEGAEWNALNGMRKIIKRNKPILAICVYHKRDDFYKLTDLIDEIYPNVYHFYFRQYRYTPTETVCYAIPDRRLKSETN